MRRTWMLLFVIALLAIFMAVPAFAAEELPDHTGCEALPAEGGTIEAGVYTVPADYDQSVTVSGEDVVVYICLHGQTWDCSNGSTRNLTVTDGATV